MIAAVLAAVVTIVAGRITTESIETRAEADLESDEAIVQLYFRQLEDDVIFLSDLLANSEILTEKLIVPSSSRSLMISLMSDLRHRGMNIRMYEHEAPADQPNFSIIQKGFLGIRTVGLVGAPRAKGEEVWLVGVAPIEGERGVERVVSLSFPLTPAYLKDISGRIGSDVTLLLPEGQMISTLPPTDLASLIVQLKEWGGLGEKAEEAWILSITSEGRPIKARLSPFLVNLSREGVLAVSMPMADLLAARRNIVSRVLLSTLVILSGASVLYLVLIRRITKPLGQLSAATREVAGGNLDLRVDVGSNDEIGDLSTSFNVMVQRLRESREEIGHWNQMLEKRVEERTRSLEAARSELKATNEQLVQALEDVRQTQDKMIRAEKLAALGQMASAVAHEVRNPLAGMKGALQVLLREQVCGERAPIVQLVIEQIDRISETTSRLLSFARPAVPRQIPTDPTELLDKTRSLVREQANQKGVEIIMNLEPVDRLFSVDPQLTLQAFLNIALNAVQATGRGGTLTIASKWRPRTGELSIAFEDTGEGMPPEVLERIFAPFFTTKHQGTGLGLYIAKDIIEQQGGSLDVASEPGVGTVFTVTLHAQESPPSQAGRTALP